MGKYYKEMIKTKSDCKWIFDKTKTIVLGIDTKTNLRVLLKSVMLTFLNIRQYPDKETDAYLSRFKSVSESLVLAGGENIFVSEKIMKTQMKDATKEKIENESNTFKSICYMSRSDESRCKTLLYDLESSSYRGRDEYPTTLTTIYDLLTR